MLRLRCPSHAPGVMSFNPTARTNCCRRTSKVVKCFSSNSMALATRPGQRADVELVHSGLDWVILRPSALTDDPGTGSVSLSMAELHTEISRDDVAATIAVLLHSPGVRRRILEVTRGKTTIASAVTALLN
jgi:NAD(P)H-binding